MSTDSETSMLILRTKPNKNSKLGIKAEIIHLTCKIPQICL